jgi:hypothetical protein
MASGRRRRTVTTVETREVWIVRRMGAAEIHPPCAECVGESSLLNAEEAARLSGLSLRDVFRTVEAGGCHFVEAPDGRLFVCPASLREAAIHGAQPPGLIAEIPKEYES